MHFRLNEFEIKRQSEIGKVDFRQQVRADVEWLGVAADDLAIFNAPVFLITNPTFKIAPVEQTNIGRTTLTGPNVRSILRQRRVRVQNKQHTCDQISNAVCRTSGNHD